MKYNKNRFYYSVFPFLLFVVLMVSLFFLNEKYDLDYTSLGILPRTIEGLKGIIFSPFIHGSTEHLFNNSIPILILGTALLYYYGKLGIKVFTIMYLLTGLLVWISARESHHIGASGIVYTLASFLFLSGLLRKERKLIALSLLVTFMYGSLFWGIFPVKEHISFESHFWGGIVGFVIAYYYRNEGPQRIRFDWEDEVDDDENEEFEWEHLKKSPNNTPTQIKKADSNFSKDKPVKRIIIKYDYKKNKGD